MSLPLKAITGIIILLLAMGPLVERFEVYSIWALNAVHDTMRLMGGLPVTH